MHKIFAFLLKYPKSASVFSGALSALAFAPTYLIFMLVLCLTAEWKMLDVQQNFRRCAVLGYWYGFGFFAAGFYWVGNALLIDVATFGWLYPITLVGAGAFFGLFTILPFAVWHRFEDCLEKITAFASVWVLMEWLRSFILTGFPWNLLGSVWAFDPIFLQTASLWGTYGLSFLTIWLAGGFYMFVNGLRKTGIAIFGGILIFMFLFGFGRMHSYQYASSEITVRLVQPSIPQQMKWNLDVLEDNLKQYIALSLEDEAPVDFVIWGETAVPFDLMRVDKYREWVRQAVPSNGYLMTGAIRYDDTQAYNSLYVINDKGDLVDFYDKNHLVPFGEYIPLRAYLPSWVRPIANNVADFGIGSPFKNIVIENFPPFGALICYEIIFPDEVVNRQSKPQWLVVLTNDGWYGNSAGPYQHLVAAQLRAVEEGITIVRSANSGISAVVNPLGQKIASVGLHEKGYVDVKLPEKLSVQTVYGSLGSRPLLSVLVVILLFLFAKNKLSKIFISEKKLTF